MIGNTLQLPGKVDNSLSATINGSGFTAEIIGGRYDKNPTGKPEWIRRSWGRGPLSPEDKTHALIFISINWDITGNNTYSLPDNNGRVKVSFTNLFPAEDGDENDYLIEVKTGSLTIEHNVDTFIAKGSFSFEVDVPQPGGGTLPFIVTDGLFYVGPTDKLRR